MLRDPDRFWNMDETSVDVEYGEWEKYFTSSSRHYGGFKAVGKDWNGKHITEVIAASAFGLVAPPFFIVAGKNVMKVWFLPFENSDIDFSESNLFTFNESN